VGIRDAAAAGSCDGTGVRPSFGIWAVAVDDSEHPAQAASQREEEDTRPSRSATPLTIPLLMIANGVPVVRAGLMARVLDKSRLGPTATRRHASRDPQW
jgi:hypothetical protein